MNFKMLRSMSREPMQLKNLLSSREVEPIADEFALELSVKFKVSRQKYHGGAIAGNDRSSLMILRAEIIRFTKELCMKAPPRAGRDQDAFDRRVDSFITIIVELLTVLYHIFRQINAQSSLATDEGKRDLKSLATVITKSK